MTCTLRTADESEEIKDIFTPVNSEHAAVKHISDRYSKEGAKIYKSSENHDAFLSPLNKLNTLTEIMIDVQL